MNNYDPLETANQLTTWVEESLSSLNTASLAEAKARYHDIKKLITQHEELHIPISENIKTEKETLEASIGASEKLTSLARELSSLAKHINSQLRNMPRPGTRRGGIARPKKLRVEFADETVICENKAVDTFIRFLRHIGLERVSELQSIKSLGHPLVSTEKNNAARQARETDGYFIETNSSTKQKAEYIRRVARQLHIQISVDIID